MKNPKAKGSSFERKIAKILNEYLGCPKDEVWVHRSPNSGGVATVSKKNDITGDLVSLSPESAWLMDNVNLECKSGYPNATFDNHFKNNKSDEINSFWKQSIDDAKKGNKHPILIFGKNRMPILIGISDKLYEEIQEELDDIKNIQSLTLKFAQNGLPCIIFFDLEKFLNCITAEMLKSILLK